MISWKGETEGRRKPAVRVVLWTSAGYPRFGVTVGCRQESPRSDGVQIAVQPGSDLIWCLLVLRKRQVRSVLTRQLQDRFGVQCMHSRGVVAAWSRWEKEKKARSLCQ